MEKKRTLPSSKVMIRLIKLLYSFYPKLIPFTLVCIFINAVVSAIPSMFQQKVISVIEKNWQTGDWNAVSSEILGTVSILAVLYGISLTAGVVYNQCMAVITQGSLKKLRVKLFNGMQDLPIRYFDQHEHGDIMSYYTNDVDTLRQLISQSIPQLMVSAISVITIFCLMMYYSIWLTIIVVGGVFVMTKVVRKVGGGSGKYFMKQQAELGKTEGLIQEMMNGQKVIKVFNHEEEAKAEISEISCM